MSHILIADDDATQLDLRKGIIESLGHEVSAALSACQTVRTLQARSVDLVIIDLRFPNAEGAPDSREGLALIRRIRELSRDMPLLVMSGWPADLDGQPEAQLVTRVMMKPVKSAALIQIVGEMITTSASAPARNLP
jgi:two-component system response regulator HydG